MAISARLAGLEVAGGHGEFVKVGERAFRSLLLLLSLAVGGGAASFTSAAAFCRSSTALLSSS